MNLLIEGLENGYIKETEMTRKVTIDGITQNLPVYKVLLSCLFYNDQNDRIATWISQYKSNHNGKTPERSDINEYNNIIEEFIVKSNPDAITKTQKNIELFTQREPGVILRDGRIIDGNRRFTCLRRLSKIHMNGEFDFFETVILDRAIESDARQIKLLELSIQHGEEGKVEYNPIDRLVGIYNDILDTKLLTVEDYANSTGNSVGDIRKLVEQAKYMVDFLDYIHAPNQYYIARDLQLNGPIIEFPAIVKKCETDEKKRAIKDILYTNILMQPKGDMTRYVRNIKNIIGTDYENTFIDEQKEIAEDVQDILASIGTISTEKIKHVVREDKDLTDRLSESMEETLQRLRKQETRNKPSQILEKASSLLDSIDTNIFMKLSPEAKKKINEELSNISNQIEVLKRSL
jgi:hypothetical protein